jgi:hypothetical protein
MIIIDEQTRQRVLCMPHTGDITYDLEGDPAIAQEDVPLIGPWADWTGSDVNVSSRSQQMFASSENELQGQDPQIIENAKIPNLSVIGTRVGTHRRRVIKRYKEL